LAKKKKKKEGGTRDWRGKKGWKSTFWCKKGFLQGKKAKGLSEGKVAKKTTKNTMCRERGGKWGQSKKKSIYMKRKNAGMERETERPRLLRRKDPHKGKLKKSSVQKGT